jgi:hypothetical protein
MRKIKGNCQNFSRNDCLTKNFARRFVMQAGATHRPAIPTYRAPRKLAKTRPRKNHGRTTMQKTALTIFSAALLAGSFVQAAAAKEHHHVRKAQRPAMTASQSYRNSNAAVRPGPAVQPDWSRAYHDEALSPPAGH